jgi:hypothetical protein
MSEAGKKMIEGAKEALIVVKCEHSLESVSFTETRAEYRCLKCQARFYVPIRNGAIP